VHPKLTKYVNAKLGIYWTEETINKLNKPPCNEKCKCNREQNYTAMSKFKATLEIDNQKEVRTSRAPNS
jgi:hypothetical protein